MRRGTAIHGRPQRRQPPRTVGSERSADWPGGRGSL